MINEIIIVILKVLYCIGQIAINVAVGIIGINMLIKFIELIVDLIKYIVAKAKNTYNKQR